jgi:hypothetical protein
MVGPGPEDRVVCPVCGLPGLPIVNGHPDDPGALRVPAGRIVLDGCLVLPCFADYMCPRAHGWWTGAPPPAGPDSPELAASRQYAAGDLDGAARAYRELLDASIVERGERDPNTRALRRTLVIVLSTAGRADEAAAAYAPLRPPTTPEEIAARIEERYRRVGLSGQPPQ